MTTTKKGIIYRGDGYHMFQPLPTVKEGENYEVNDCPGEGRGYQNLCARLVETITQELTRGNSLVSLTLVQAEDWQSDKPTVKARLVFDDGIRKTA